MVPTFILAALLALLSTFGLGLSTHCWWPFYMIGVLALAGMLGGTGWAISRAFVAGTGGAASWWATNRWRVLQAFLATLLVITILWIVAIWARGAAPACEVGCIGASSSMSTPSPSEGTHVLSIATGKPAVIRLPPMYRWDLVDGTIPGGWTTEAKVEGPDRIQIFSVVPPVNQVNLAVRISKCATAQACAW